MSVKHSRTLISIALGAVALLASCTADTDAVNLPPTLTTGEPVSVTRTTAILSGSLATNGSVVDKCGIAVSPSSSQMLDNSVYLVFEGDVTANTSFNLQATNLKSGTSYFYRTYAMSGGAYAYGEYKILTTPSISAPAVSDLVISDVLASQASVSATISDKGVSEDIDISLSSPMIWYKRLGDAGWQGSTASLTTTSGDWQSAVAQLDGGKTIVGVITGLQPSSTYAVYASVTCAGEGHSEIGTLVTGETSNPELSAVTVNLDATGMALNLSATINNPGKSPNGGVATVVNKGFIYSINNQTPEIEGSIAVESIDESDNFTAQLGDLPNATTMYIRAYAQNEIGYGYGPVAKYTTPEIIIPFVHSIMVTEVTDKKASVVGYLNPNNVEIVEAGFYLGTQKYVVENVKQGTFTYEFTNLVPNTRYKCYAYCINAKGAEFTGENLIFQTKSSAPSADDIGLPTIQ